MIHDESTPTGLKPTFFNEVFDGDGAARAHYSSLLDALDAMREGEFAGRISRANERLRDLGATSSCPTTRTTRAGSSL